MPQTHIIQDRSSPLLPINTPPTAFIDNVRDGSLHLYSSDPQANKPINQRPRIMNNYPQDRNEQFKKMSFKCSAKIHTYYEYQPVHRHECRRMTEKLCMDCVVDGHISQCPFCDTKLELNRCFYCNSSVEDVAYKQLNCKTNHKICRGCFKKYEFVNCRTGRHTYCKNCHLSKAAEFAKCCDICDGCAGTVEGGKMHWSPLTDWYYCGKCAIPLRIAQQPKVSRPDDSRQG
jgi:hypothetical protein